MNVWKITGYGFLFSFLIAASQLLQPIRVFDVDDLIFNPFGVLLGGLIWQIWCKNWKGHLCGKWYCRLLAAVFLGRFFLFDEILFANILCRL